MVLKNVCNYLIADKVQHPKRLGPVINNTTQTSNLVQYLNRLHPLGSDNMLTGNLLLKIQNSLLLPSFR